MPGLNPSHPSRAAGFTWGKTDPATPSENGWIGLTIQLKNGWLSTGDIGVMNPDGHFKIVDRKKDMILVSGFNVYPPELEGLINSHPDVHHSAVVMRKVPDNEEVVAFVQPVRGKKIDVEFFKHWLGERVAPYKKPSHLIIMAQLPSSPSGKPLKHKLVEIAKQLNQGKR